MATRVRNRYVPDRKGVVGILTGNPMRGALSRVGQRGKKLAEGMAPVKTGKYKNSFEVRLGTRGRGARKRAVVTLKNTDSKAASVEFGTGPRISAGVFYPGTKGHRTLGRTQSALRIGGYVS